MTAVLSTPFIPCYETHVHKNLPFYFWDLQIFGGVELTSKSIKL